MKRLIAIICQDRIFAFELKYYYDLEGRIRHEKRMVLKKNPIIDSISKDFPVADFYEREIHELFGIIFKNGSNERLFLSENNEIITPLIKKQGDKNA